MRYKSKYKYTHHLTTLKYLFRHVIGRWCDLWIWNQIQTPKVTMASEVSLQMLGS